MKSSDGRSKSQQVWDGMLQRAQDQKEFINSRIDFIKDEDLKV
jgi:hypothetical protein